MQLDEKDSMWLLGFGRGQLSAKGTWKQQTPVRLHRSLRIIKKLSPQLRYSEPDRERLIEGYFSESKSA